MFSGKSDFLTAFDSRRSIHFNYNGGRRDRDWNAGEWFFLSHISSLFLTKSFNDQINQRFSWWKPREKYDMLNWRQATSTLSCTIELQFNRTFNLKSLNWLSFHTSMTILVFLQEVTIDEFWNEGRGRLHYYFEP